MVGESWAHPWPITSPRWGGRILSFWSRAGKDHTGHGVGLPALIGRDSLVPSPFGKSVPPLADRGR